MKYFAGDNRVSTEPFADAIEITEQQYLEAIEAMIAGDAVQIEDGVMVVYTPEPSGA